MADVDPAAIRNLVAVWNRWAAVASSPNPFAVDLGEACTELLAELDLRDAELVRVSAVSDRWHTQAMRALDALDAANARTAERCRELMAADRRVEQANAERDHAQAAVAGARVICDALRVYPDIGPSLDLIERALDGWTTPEDTASDEKPPERPQEYPVDPETPAPPLGAV